MSIKHRLQKLEASMHSTAEQEEMQELWKVMWFYGELTTAPSCYRELTSEELRHSARRFWQAVFNEDPPSDVMPYYRTALQWLEEGSNSIMIQGGNGEL